MMMTKALLASVAHFFLLFSLLLSTTPHHISLHGMADARSPRRNSFIQFIMEFKSQTTAHNTKWMKNLTETSPCLISLLTLWLWLSSVCWIFAGWWTCSRQYLKLLHIRWAYFFFAIHAQHLSHLATRNIIIVLLITYINIIAAPLKCASCTWTCFK